MYKATGLKESMPPEAKPESEERTCVVMQYELGAIARSLVYAEHALRELRSDVRRNQLVRAHYQEVRINLADLITQCRLLAEQVQDRASALPGDPIDWGLGTLIQDGEERFQLRMEEIRKGALT